MDERAKATMMKYRKASREQIQVDMAKGMKAKIKAYAESRGQSMSALIMQLLEMEMRESGFHAEWEKKRTAEQAAERAEQEAAKQAEIDRLKAENAAAMQESMK